jgi:hypothetical protein
MKIKTLIKSFDKIISDFNSGLKDFVDSMQKVDQDFKDDIEKSNSNAKSRAIKDKENLDKIWGKKD